MFKLAVLEAFRYPTQGKRIPAAWWALPWGPAILAALTLIGYNLYTKGHHNDGAEKIVLGVVLVSLVATIFLCLLWWGFALRAIRDVSQGIPQLPPWRDRPGLARGGAAWLLTCLILGSPVLVLLLGTVMASRRTSGEPEILWILSLTAAVLLLLFVLPMAMLRMARHRSVLAAVNPAGIISDILKAPADYVVVLAAILWIAFWTEVIICLAVGMILLPGLCIYGLLVTAHLLGQYWRLYLA